MICFHKVNFGEMCMYMYLDYFQTESLKTEPLFCSEMVRQKYSFKRKDGTSSSTQQAKLQKVKKEKKRTANQQEEVMKKRSQQGDKLNLWKVEDMEAAVKE